MAKQPPAQVPGLRVTAKTPSYYSAGITTPFANEPRDIALTDLTKAQAAELRADPWLIVQDCEIKAAEAETKSE